MRAAVLGHLAVVKILLTAGADKDGAGPADTPLMRAAYAGHLAIVETLLAAGADVNIRSKKSGGFALHFAADAGHRDIVLALVNKLADVDALDAYGDSPLMRAAASGHLPVVETLLAEGSLLNIRSADNGAFAIHLAARAGCHEIVSVLLKQGADKDSLTNDGYTPLMVAALKVRLTVVEVLLETGADTNIRSIDGFSALDMAADQGHVRILKAILSFGVDPNAPDSDGNTALHHAAAADQAEAIEEHINAGADTERKTSNSSTPLLSAASFTACKAVCVLLRHGSAVNARDCEGHTALHWFCYKRIEGLEAAVDLLLRWGADEMTLDEDGQTAADALSEPNDEESQLSQDEIERVRLLLARAPADRGWRRRGWLVMVSARVRKEVAARCDTKDSPTNADTACQKTRMRESRGEGTLGADESTRFGDESGAEGQGKGLGGVVTALLELELEGVFRTVVSFL